MKISRLSRVTEGPTLALFDLVTDDLTVRGMRLVRGRDGLFVSGPSKRKPTGEYEPIVTFAPTLKESILSAAEAEYSSLA